LKTAKVRTGREAQKNNRNLQGIINKRDAQHK
jgi:hypothetical protein